MDVNDDRHPNLGDRGTTMMQLCPAAALTILILFSTAADAQSKTEATSGEEFENIEILTDMPAVQMGKVMNIMSASLGVSCNHCHQDFDFAKEGLAQKDIARKMLAMTFKLNDENFNGRPVVTCNTCHRGQTHPTSELIALPIPAPAVPPPATAIALPADIIANYLAVLGEPTNLRRIENRKIHAERVEPNGQTEPETIWQTSNGNSHTLTQYGDVAVIEGFDGTRAWKTVQSKRLSLKTDEAEQIRLESLLAFPRQADEYFHAFDLAQAELLGDRKVIVLSKKGTETSADQLFFDAQSSLLIRRTSSIPTVLGAFKYQIDYGDYQEFEAVKLPTTIHFSVPGIRWTRRVLRVESNVEIDTQLFVGPND
jgi:hypothetical protein